MIGTRIGGALLLIASLAACSGGASSPISQNGALNSAGTAQSAELAQRSAAADLVRLPNPHNVSTDDAIRVARGSTRLEKSLEVDPNSLDFANTTAQAITVKVPFPAIVFAGVSDERIAHVDPAVAVVLTGSVTFTVKPLANGHANLGITDSLLEGARVPIAVALGSVATPTPTATPTTKPTSKPTSKPTATPTPKPTATPTAKPTATPTSKPTAKPTATPTPKPTATPTPKPTAPPASCPAPPLDPNTATITLTGKQQTVTVPCFKDFLGSAIVPASGNAGDTIALQVSTDKNFGAVANATYGTPIVYTSLQPASSVTFSNSSATISTTVSSPSKIAAGHTYAVQAYVPAFGAAIQTVTGLKPTGHSISFSIVPPGGTFPGIQAVIIVYQST